MAQQDFEVEVLDQETNEFELSFKLIIIGDSGVGKSCLALRATKDSFEKLYSATIGFEFMTFFIRVDGKAIKLQIWDTCGQEVYRSLISSFYNNSALAIIVYSIDNDESFNHLEFWLNELRNKGNPDINIFLIGNKVDLEDNRKVTKEEAIDFVDNNKIKLFLETSAKTGFNAKNIFIEAAKVLYEQHLKYKDRPSRPESLASIVTRDSNRSLPMNVTLEDENTERKKKDVVEIYGIKYKILT